jgi:hypothetical protein
MSTLTVTFVITDSAGVTFTGTTTAQSDAVTGSAVITPAIAPAGTTRNITVTGTSSAGLALTYGTPTAPGTTFTPVAGQNNQWTFVY